MITRKSFITKVYKKKGGVLTSAYGTPRDGGRRKHAGEDWDIAGTEHPKLYAPYNCIVHNIRENLADDRGRYVELKIAPNWYILFQHDYHISVSRGQRVAAGQQIAVQGGTGKTVTAYRSHAHVEWAHYPMGDIRRKPVNPGLSFYPLFTAPKYPVKTVVVSDLHIRRGHSTSAEVANGYAELRAYKIYEQVLEDGYIWGRIDWVANLWIALRTADGKKVYAK